MRLGTLQSGEVVAVNGEAIFPLAAAGFDGSMCELANTAPDLLSRMALELASAAHRQLELTELAAPIAKPGKIVAIGLNYVDHAAETALELPKEPLIFAKFPSSITGPFDPILVPERLTSQVDFEAELGVVVGRRARNVSAAKALDHVFGYTVMNDVSARDLQFGDGQWVRGKSLETFCPLGPVILTANEVEDPQRLQVGCAVDGITMQDASTRDMIFGVAELIQYLSAHFTLEPGDVIATGTPSGVGFTRNPPVYLVAGNVLSTWVRGIGTLTNLVVEA